MPATVHFNDPKYQITRQLYDFIEAEVERRTYPPTLAEMADAIYLSKSGVVRHLGRLEAWGWIAREPKRMRGITLLRRKRDSPESA